MLSISNNVSLPKNNSQFLKTSNSAAAFFDGTNDYIDASLLGSSISKTAGTISHWVKITASANNEILFSVSDGTSGNDKIQTVFMTNTSSGQFQAVYKSGGVANKAVYNYPAVDIVGAGWFHLAMTYTITEENALTIKLYFNGALQNTFSGVADTIAEGVAFDRVILGKNANADNSYLQGFIDECAYYTRVLTADEILRIYNAKGTFNHITQTDVDSADGVNLLKQWLRFGDGGNDFASDQTTGIVDMSNNSLGSELVTDGDFSNASSFNLTVGNPTISGGTGNFPDTTNSFIIQSSVVPASVKVYTLQYEVVESNGDLLRLAGGNSAFGTIALDSSVGLHSTIITSNGSQTSLQFNNAAAFIGKIDNISLKEVQGNPAFTSGALINQDDNPTA